MNEETIFDTNEENKKAQQKKEDSNKTVKEMSNLKTQTKVAENKQKRKMGAVGVAGVAGAAGIAGAAIGMMTPLDVFSDTSNEGNLENGGMGAELETSGGGLSGHDMKVATGVDDSMSFNEAFAAAREEVGAGGIFVWHGKPYGTYYKDEWEAMSPEEINQYWADVHHTVHNNDYLHEHLAHDEPTTTGSSNVDPLTDPNGGEGNGDETNEGIPTDQQVNNNGEETNEIPVDPVGGWDGNEELEPLIEEDIVIEPVHDVEEIGVIEGVEIPEEIPIDEEITIQQEGCVIEPTLEENPDVDFLASNFIDPEIPIDNGMDMGEFV